MWIAKDSDGECALYLKKPITLGRSFITLGRSFFTQNIDDPSYVVPQTMIEELFGVYNLTPEDSPIELEVIIKTK